MKYLIKISYDGSKFSGFQRLNDLNSIQKEIENVLSKINKKEVLIKGSGRTDAGVHALGQCCHFELDINIPPNNLKRAMNSLLPDSIYVRECNYANDDFHARFNVVRKYYTYIINLGEYNPIKNNYIYNYCNKVDVNAMKEASMLLIGKHSYKAFVSGERVNYDSEIYSINFVINNDLLYISFVGKSFYRYMVRNLVGALMMVGTSKINKNELKYMLDTGDKKFTYITVPACGLYLENVEY